MVPSLSPSPDDGAVLRAQNLGVRLGSRWVVRGLDLNVVPGQRLALLGPNGAGKSTTMRLCMGLLSPDEGSVTIGPGWKPDDPRARAWLGIAPQDLAVYPLLSAHENVTFFGSIYGLSGARLKERVAWALDLAGLARYAEHRVQTYSGGMQRRLNIACAVVHEPKVVLLDEPTVGVDPQSRNHILRCLEELSSHGTALIYSTHYMEEADRLCDTVAIVDQGKVLAEGSPQQLVSRHGGGYRVTAARLDGGIRSKEVADLDAALGFAAEVGKRSRDVRIQHPSLETVFLRLTGRELRDECVS